jgi:hypothetical protein
MVLAVAMGTLGVQADEVLWGTKIGAMDSINSSISMGGILSPVREGLPGTGQFGMLWDRPVEVTSITITHSIISSRPLETASYPTEALIFVGPNECVGSITLPAPDANGVQTCVLDSAIFAKNSYVMLVVTDTYNPPNPYKFDHPYVADFDMSATAAGPVDRNVNLDPGVTITPSRAARFIMGTNPSDYNVLRDSGSATTTVTHSVFSNTDMDRRIWLWPGQEPLTVTAEYETPQDIGSIGLGFAGDLPDLACPKFINVYATYEGGMVSEPIRFDLGSDGGITSGLNGLISNTQYGRYVFQSTLENVIALTIEFPDGNDANNWWVNPATADGDGRFFGLTEFQAFAPQVPEPATLVLLSLGGLAMLRRRK